MVTSQKIENEIEIIGFGIGAPMGNINKGTLSILQACLGKV